MDHAEFLSLCEPIAQLVDKKGRDYNSGTTMASYFPFGHKSYVQMIFLKTMRLISLVIKEDKPIYDSILDTAMDLVAYTIFYIKFLKEKRDE